MSHWVTVIIIKFFFTSKYNQKVQIKKYRRKFHKGKYKDMRRYLAKLDWHNMLRNKTTIACWNILKYVIESIIDQFVPVKNKENGLETLIKRSFYKNSVQANYVEGL